MAGMHSPLVTTNDIRHLKPELLDNPIQMIDDFCFMLDIKECRAMLWKMTCAFLGSEHADGLDRHQRSDYIFFYEMMASLIEAAYLMDAQKQTEKVKRKKKK